MDNVVETFGNYVVLSEDWDSARVVDSRRMKVLKRFRGELSEENASRYAYDMHIASKYASRAVENS